VDPESTDALADPHADFEESQAKGDGLGGGEFGAVQQSAQQGEQDESHGVQEESTTGGAQVPALQNDDNGPRSRARLDT